MCGLASGRGSQGQTRQPRREPSNEGKLGLFVAEVGQASN